MAILPVTLAEMFRPWRAAGVLHLLPDPECVDAFVAEQEGVLSFDLPSAEQSPASSSEFMRPGSSYEAAPASSGIAVAAGSYRTPGTAGASSTSGETGAAIPMRPTVTATPPGSVPVAAVSAPPEDIQLWPAAWQALARRATSAPLVWTYPELGLDLLGQGSKERSAYLKKLISELALPRGTSAFWPLTLPETMPETAPEIESEAAALSDSAFFQAGLQRIKPSTVVIFGASGVALTGLPLTLHVPFTQQIILGRLFVLLPDFVSLLQPQNEGSRPATYLRSITSGLRILS